MNSRESTAGCCAPLQLHGYYLHQVQTVVIKRKERQFIYTAWKHSVFNVLLQLSTEDKLLNSLRSQCRVIYWTPLNLFCLQIKANRTNKWVINTVLSSYLKDKAIKLGTSLAITSSLCLQNSVSIPKPRVRSSVMYTDSPPEDKQQKTEATHHTQHNVYRLWDPGVRAG